MFGNPNIRSSLVASILWRRIFSHIVVREMPSAAAALPMTPSFRRSAFRISRRSASSRAPSSDAAVVVRFPVSMPVREEIAGRDPRSRREGDRPLDPVAQFADVARPRVRTDFAKRETR